MALSGDVVALTQSLFLEKVKHVEIEFSPGINIALPHSGDNAEGRGLAIFVPRCKAYIWACAGVFKTALLEALSTEGSELQTEDIEHSLVRLEFTLAPKVEQCLKRVPGYFLNSPAGLARATSEITDTVKAALLAVRGELERHALQQKAEAKRKSKARFSGLRLKLSEQQLALDLAKASRLSPSTPFYYFEVDQFEDHVLTHPGLSRRRDRALLLEIRSLARNHLLDLTGEDRRGTFQVTQDGLDFAAYLESSAADRPDIEGTSDSLTDPARLESSEDNLRSSSDFEKIGTPPQAPRAGDGDLAASGSTEATATQVSKVVSRIRVEVLRRCREEIDPRHSAVGGAPAFLQVFEQIRYTNALGGATPVLLLGEPGVGKTHIARLFHESSDRGSRVFKAVNGASAGGDLNIQRTEWFGCGPKHGLHGIPPDGRKGHLGEADGGTLFIDDFDAMSRELQGNFLSVLEGRGIEQVGGRTVNFNVRCIFAANVDLDHAVKDGKLRRDLLDRIAEHIVVPPLRERIGDIRALAVHFAEQYKVTFDDRCLLALLRSEWPRNVRGLKQVVDGAVARARLENQTLVRAEHLDLPGDVTSLVIGMNAAEANEELWRTADRTARAEGFEHGSGLQKRAAEILGVSEAQASKRYDALGL